MGTRADFYVGRGKQAEWLGSIAFDGYPEGVGHKENPDGHRALRAATEAEYREAVAAVIASRDDGTKPEDGWPWPWEDSGLTDYAYAFDGGKVWATTNRFWFEAAGPTPEEDAEDSGGRVEFPDMTERKAVAFGPRSGLLVVSMKR